MFKINQIDNINPTPWDIPLYKRLNIVRSAIEKGKKVAILLYEKPDSSTFRYRGYNIFQATEKSIAWRAVYLFEDEYEEVNNLLSEIKLLVLIRIKWTRIVDQLITRAKLSGVTVLYDIDDLIFDIDYLNVVTNTINVTLKTEHEYEFWFSIFARIGFVASRADGFIAPNKLLGSKLTYKFGKPNKQISNSFNDEQFIVSNKFRAIKSQINSERPFTIGYFSGSPTHINDFNIAKPEIQQLLDEYDDIQLLVVGYMDFTEDMNEYVNNGRVVYTPHVEFPELQRLIAQVDVNIVPLVNNDFTNCKSELKFFEASIVDTITLASPIYAYRNSIIDGQNGFLCESGQWYSKISALYHNKFDNHKICKMAYEHSVNKYYGQEFLSQIEDCYNSFI